MIYQSNTIQVNEFRDGIVQLTFCAASSVNKLDQSTLVALDDAIHAIYNFKKSNGYNYTRSGIILKTINKDRMNKIFFQ